MPQTDQEQLTRLLASRHAAILIQTHEESHALDLVRSVAINEQKHALVWSVTSGLRDAVLDDNQTIADTAHPAGALVHLATHTPGKTIIIMLDLCSHLDDQRTHRSFRELIPKLRKVQSTIILIDSSEDLPSSVIAETTRFDLSLPDAEELEQIIRTTLRQINESHPIKIELRREDLNAIIRNLQGLSRSQVIQAITDIALDDRRVDASDLSRIITFKKRALRHMGVLEPVETLLNLEDIGGLKGLKKWLGLREQALSPQAIEFGIEPPVGILMLGVQGTGKSLSAKAVATAWRRPLLRLDVGALFDRFIGESEKRLREALRQAEMMSPVVLWIDEIEKAFASAASQSVDGGLSKRMFGSLLTWMQEHSKPVFVVATANDVSALPPELLRKGRFDEVFFIDLPDLEARKQIIKIHLQKRKRDPELFDIAEIAADCEGYSGAEIEAAIKASIYEAFQRNSMLSNEMIKAALKNSPPLTVTMREKVEALRAWSKGRCTPAD